LATPPPSLAYSNDLGRTLGLSNVRCWCSQVSVLFLADRTPKETEPDTRPVRTQAISATLHPLAPVHMRLLGLLLGDCVSCEPPNPPTHVVISSLFVPPVGERSLFEEGPGETLALGTMPADLYRPRQTPLSKPRTQFHPILADNSAHLPITVLLCPGDDPTQTFSTSGVAQEIFVVPG